MIICLIQVSLCLLVAMVSPMMNHRLSRASAVFTDRLTIHPACRLVAIGNLWRLSWIHLCQFVSIGHLHWLPWILWTSLLSLLNSVSCYGFVCSSWLPLVNFIGCRGNLCLYQLCHWKPPLVAMDSFVPFSCHVLASTNLHCHCSFCTGE